MGLFTSLCPECHREIDWFLQAPKDFICECGRAVTQQEIEDSWWKQVYQGGGNPVIWANLKKLQINQLEEMLSEWDRTHRAVKMPLPGEDIYITGGHIDLIQSVLKEKMRKD